MEKLLIYLKVFFVCAAEISWETKREFFFLCFLGAMKNGFMEFCFGFMSAELVEAMREGSEGVRKEV